jgi:MoxR-like ATPase
MSNLALTNSKLDFWIKTSKYVLFIGKQGVGKTTIVKDAFERNGIKYKIFSGATMDPWVDFIGIPKEKTENSLPESFKTIKELSKIDAKLATNWISSNWKLSNEDAEKVLNHALNQKEDRTYLDLIKPKEFANGSIEALFFDEYNRSHKKVRNAIMELQQFKSINGNKFPNLKVVWAAMNPFDENQEYDVEKIDPAQEDRFHVKFVLEYKPNKEWFVNRYGKNIAEPALRWWDDLPEKIKNEVSPRRLEYAIDYYLEEGDLRDILPSHSNVFKLINAISVGPISSILSDFVKNDKKEEAKVFLESNNNYDASINVILKSATLRKYFLPLIEPERLSKLMQENNSVFKEVVSDSKNNDYFYKICKSIVRSNANPSLAKRIRTEFTETSKEDEELSRVLDLQFGIKEI